MRLASQTLWQNKIERFYTGAEPDSYEIRLAANRLQGYWSPIKRSDTWHRENNKARIIYQILESHPRLFLASLFVISPKECSKVSDAHLEQIGQHFSRTAWKIVDAQCCSKTFLQMCEFLNTIEADRLSNLVGLLGSTIPKAIDQRPMPCSSDPSLSRSRLEQICTTLAAFPLLQHDGQSLADLVRATQPQVLETCNAMELKRLWEQCPPVRYPSNLCWPTDPPSVATILEQALNDGINNKTVWVEGKRGTLLESLAILCPDLSTNFGIQKKGACCFILDIPGDNLPRLDFPKSHDQHGNCLFQRRGSNVASKGALVDLHIDGGREGLSTTLHDCEKLWFLAPMTTKNGELFSKMNISARLFRGLAELEGCVVTVTTSNDVLYLPAGTLHATVTLKSGVLTGVDFITATAIRTAFKTFKVLLQYSIDIHLEQDLNNFCNVIKSALTAGDKTQLLAIQEWLRSGTALLVQTRDRKLDDLGNKKPKKAWGEAAVFQIVTAWTDVLEEVDLTIMCPCGEGQGNAHVRSHILQSLREAIPSEATQRPDQYKANKRKTNHGSDGGGRKRGRGK